MQRCPFPWDPRNSSGWVLDTRVQRMQSTWMVIWTLRLQGGWCNGW